MANQQSPIYCKAVATDEQIHTHTNRERQPRPLGGNGDRHVGLFASLSHVRQADWIEMAFPRAGWLYWVSRFRTTPLVPVANGPVSSRIRTVVTSRLSASTMATGRWRGSPLGTTTTRDGGGQSAGMSLGAPFSATRLVLAVQPPCRAVQHQAALHRQRLSKLRGIRPVRRDA